MRNACDDLIDVIKNIKTSLGDLRLNSAFYSKFSNTLSVNLVSDVAVDCDGVEFIKKSILEKFNNNILVEILVRKSICDKDIAKNTIYSYINNNCFSVAHTINKDNIIVFSSNKKITFEIVLQEEIANYFERTNFLDDLCEYLSRQFSNYFEGKIRIDNSQVQKEVEYQIESVNKDQLEDNNFRYIKVDCATKYLDDKIYDLAVYIADGIESLGSVYFMGKVISKEERQTQKGKPYFIITIDDTSGRVSGKFFTSDKNKLKKLEKISEGSVIILRGENELFQGRASLMIKGINLCEFPPNFKLQEKQSKKAPDKYSLVFPMKVEITKQADLFSISNKYDDEFLNNEYVVVDIETTGTDVINDKITEIGAVKIKNGNIVEQFQTLVNPKVHISDRIVELTGITDELVKDAPTLDMVFPDFFKFLGDGVFVAHNADFDYRFLKNAGKELGYIIKNDYVDTLALARKKLPKLKHHKLNVVCDYYNIVFRHHRALSDALATAEMYLELIKE